MIAIAGFSELSELLIQQTFVLYRGFSIELNKTVIIKKVLEEHRSQYNRQHGFSILKYEYELIHKLAIEGVLKPISSQVIHNDFLLIFENVDAIPLSHYLASSLSDRTRFLKIGFNLASSLNKVHAEGIIHKAICPSAFLINPKTYQTYLIDFTNASNLNNTIQVVMAPSIPKGSLSYISPELTGWMNHAVDFRTDLYSLGVSFYEMVTGQLPFEMDDPMALIHAHIARQPQNPSEINPDVDEMIELIILKLLQKTAERRYQSAFSLANDLNTCLAKQEAKGEITPFALGEHDLYDRFQVPHRLYGRQTQVAELMACFDRAGQGEAEFVLVAGYSGIGKSALINEIHKPIVKHHGFFISGKFDQLQRDVPFSSLILAFQDLVNQLLTLDSEQLSHWKDQLLSALGENGAVIIDVVPEIELIIGPQSEVISLGPIETQMRFNMVFESFLRVFTKIEHPLVIFIDDLQWADTATLTFIKTVMSSRDHKHLLMLGAYRDNEVNPTHPFTLAIEEIKNSHARLHLITLGPLEEKHLCEMLSESFSTSEVRVATLAQLLLRKTGGNPFFIIQFLLMLYDEKLIKLDPQARQWVWDIGKLESQEFTDNVVDLMAQKVRKLPHITQSLLRLAACIGAKYRLDTLAIISGKPVVDVARGLWPAVSEGLIQTLDDGHKLLLNMDAHNQPSDHSSYPEAVDKFLHDRIQQAAYQLIETSQRRHVHLKIGHEWLSRLSEEAIEESLFDIVSHLNFGRELIDEQQEQIELARLNLRAGIKAKKSTAWSTAIHFLDTGIALLPKDSWHSHYNLSYQFNIELMDALFRGGEFDRGDALYGTIRAELSDTHDIAILNNLAITAYSIDAYAFKGIEIGLETLKLLGLDLTSQNTLKQISKDEEQLHRHIEKSGMDSLLELPLLSESKYTDLINTLIQVHAPFYTTGSDLYCPSTTSILLTMFKHGRNEYLPYALASQAAMQAICDNYSLSYKFSHLALKAIGRFDDLDTQTIGRCLMLVSNYSLHLGSDIHDIVAIRTQGYTACLGVGDTYWAAYSYLDGYSVELFACQNINELNSRYDHVLKAVNRILEQSYLSLVIQKNLLLNLKGEINQLSLSTDEHEEEHIQALRLASPHTSKYLTVSKVIICFIKGAYREVVELFNENEAENRMRAAKGTYNIIIYYLFSYISMLKLGGKKERNKQHFIYARETIEALAEACPNNYLMMHHLLRAEECRSQGDTEQTIHYFEAAIKESQTQRIPLFQALANALYGDYWLSQHRPPFALLYFTEARKVYHQLRAYGAARDIEQRYADLDHPTLEQVDEESPLQRKDVITRRDLDLAAVIKVSQSISKETDLNSLIGKLLKITLESAGAQRGVILLQRDGKLWVEADSGLDEHNMTLFQSHLADDAKDINHPIVNYVQRTGKSVVINNPEDAKPFLSGDKLTGSVSKSILCIPVRKQDSLLGVFYLENNLASNAYTPERLELLEIITAQAAISLENALIYSEHMELMRELEKNEVTLQAIIDNAKTQISLKDLDGKYLLTNTAFEEAFTTQLDSLLGQDDGMLFDSETVTALLRNEREVIEKKTTIEFEQSLQISDEARHFITVKFPLLAANREVYGICRISTDITEQKREEVDRLELERKFFTAQRLESIGRLASGIAHDFNNTLNAIYGFTEFSLMELNEGCVDAAVLRENIGLILDSAERAGELTQKLLMFSCQQVSKPSSLNFNTIIHAMETILTRLLGDNYQIEIAGDASLLNISADESQMEQVILNFVVNARDAMPNGGTIYFSTRNVPPTDPVISRCPETKATTMVEMSVTDTGCGMPPNVVERVFEPFFSTKGDHQGSGLGLSTTYGVIKQSNGYIYCDSTEDQGTTFTVMLPAEDTV